MIMTLNRSTALLHGWRLRASSAVLPFRSLFLVLASILALWLLSACRASQHVAQTTEEKELLSLKTSSASNSSSSSVLSFLQSYGLHIDSIVITMPPFVSGDNRLTLIGPDTLHGDGTVLPPLGPQGRLPEQEFVEICVKTKKCRGNCVSLHP